MLKYFYIILSIFIVQSTCNLFAQQNKTEAKIDTILAMQKEIHKEVTMNEPLTDKNYGFEVNLFRLISWEDKKHSLSAGFSFFNIDRNAEIALPIFFGHERSGNKLMQEFIIDCQYRYFLGSHQDGFYLSALIRYNYLHGSIGENVFFDFFKDDEYPKHYGTEHKFGFGFGFGYRYFSYNGLYWGASISYGRFITGNHNVFLSSTLEYDNDNKYFLDIEFLKFGYSF